jgi:ATP synthase protein I
MNEVDGKGGAEELSQAVRLRQERRDSWEREGERPLWKNLSMIGSLGWLIIVPTLAGSFAGRLLDRWFNQGIFWTATMIFLGVSLGCYLAWQKVKGE